MLNDKNFLSALIKTDWQLVLIKSLMEECFSIGFLHGAFTGTNAHADGHGMDYIDNELAENKKRFVDENIKRALDAVEHSRLG